MAEISVSKANETTGSVEGLLEPAGIVAARLPRSASCFFGFAFSVSGSWKDQEAAGDWASVASVATARRFGSWRRRGPAGGWITEKEDGGCGRWSVATAGLLLPLEAVRRRPVGGGCLNRKQETPVWLLVLGAKNPNGRVAARNEGDAVNGVCWPGLRGEG
ncbi:hypothetical protein NC652_024434 [Populus alba x Populus x berolinensis]|nr:hypothetical protein NC652_024434 [Populus alba x Populus x berolinensis]